MRAAPGSRVLDVGSGTGRPVAERIAATGHDVTGIDGSPRMVEIAREQVPTARFLLADLRTHLSPPGPWDAAAADSVEVGERFRGSWPAKPRTCATRHTAAA